LSTLVPNHDATEAKQEILALSKKPDTTDSDCVFDTVSQNFAIVHIFANYQLIFKIPSLMDSVDN